MNEYKLDSIGARPSEYRDPEYDAIMQDESTHLVAYEEDAPIDFTNSLTLIDYSYSRVPDRNAQEERDRVLELSFINLSVLIIRNAGISDKVSKFLDACNWERLAHIKFYYCNLSFYTVRALCAVLEAKNSCVKSLTFHCIWFNHTSNLYLLCQGLLKARTVRSFSVKGSNLDSIRQLMWNLPPNLKQLTWCEFDRNSTPISEPDDFVEAIKKQTELEYLDLSGLQVRTRTAIELLVHVSNSTIGYFFMDPARVWTISRLVNLNDETKIHAALAYLVAKNMKLRELCVGMRDGVSNESLFHGGHLNPSYGNILVALHKHPRLVRADFPVYNARGIDRAVLPARRKVNAFAQQLKCPLRRAMIEIIGSDLQKPAPPISILPVDVLRKLFLYVGFSHNL